MTPHPSPLRVPPSPTGEGFLLERMEEAEKELTKFIERHHTALWSSLTDAQKEIFNKYEDCATELSELRERECFVEGFRIGGRMTYEVMSLEIE